MPPIATDELKNFTLPVYPKSDEEKKFLKETLEKSFIFADLGERELNSIIDAFEKTDFQADAEILHQGDETADYFYVVYKGSVLLYCR